VAGLGFDLHAIRYRDLASPHVWAAIDLDEALETDAHATEQAARLASAQCAAQGALAGGRQGRGHRLAGIGRHRPTSKRELDRIAPADQATTQR
jgi:hypothetical protein